jgi:hypothetical protein
MRICRWWIPPSSPLLVEASSLFVILLDSPSTSNLNSPASPERQTQHQSRTSVVCSCRWGQIYTGEHPRGFKSKRNEGGRNGKTDKTKWEA